MRISDWSSDVCSSDLATYGDGAAGFDDDADREHLARLRPLNGYGWSKHLFDRWVARRVAENAASDGAGTPPQWAGLKFFNVYGPNAYPKDGQASVACHLFGQLTPREPAKIFHSNHPAHPHRGALPDSLWVVSCIDIILRLTAHPP